MTADTIGLFTRCEAVLGGSGHSATGSSRTACAASKSPAFITNRSGSVVGGCWVRWRTQIGPPHNYR
jgi:hypothetical protein